MTEVWKEVPGYEGTYEVSNLGRVKCLAAVSISGHQLKEKILKQTPNGDGHLQVGLRGRLHTVHSVVALAFIGPRPFDGAQVRHLNDDPSDNGVWNLAYGTSVENAADRLKNNGRLVRDPARAASIAAKLRSLLAIGPVSYKDMAAIAIEFGVCAKTVRRSMDKLKSS